MAGFMTNKFLVLGSLTTFGAVAWYWREEDSHSEVEQLLDLMDREEMERLKAAAYNGAHLFAGETMEHTETEEVNEKDLNEELDEAEDGIQQETEKVNDLQNISEELEGAKVGEIEFSNNNLGNIALDDDLERAHKNIESLKVGLERADARNDKLRIELLAKAYVGNELEKAYEEIWILPKKLERSTDDLKTANEKLLEMRDLEEYVESAASSRR
ncbi:tropomyosin alpha-4 chain-like [Palaemon carinicauda]|uniref:tropomyosin alpha-4 chain-like n=1 Tax=Palaemon carinicauda TaxID=392227 RepID=UPI0035B67233